MVDPYAEAWALVAEAILESEGALPPYVRRGIARRDDPADLAPLLDKVRQRAFAIVDADVEGRDVDVVIEGTLAAALGVADERRLAALKALG